MASFSSVKKDKIKHVVLLLMENRSFDHMLGCFPGVDGVDPKAPRVNKDSSGVVYEQKPTTELQIVCDPKHEAVNVAEQLKDNMGGFVRDFLSAYPDAPKEAVEDIMGYYPLGFLPALHSLARDFSICNHWHASIPGPTWPNRCFALSGTSNGQVVMPVGVKDLNMTMDQTQVTLFDRLNEVGKTWKCYFHDFPASLVLVNQRTVKNRAGYFEMAQFFADAAGPESKFPELAFIEPKYFGMDENDDHPPHNIMKGQKLIADVYNALRSNQELWESTLFVVYYDEHGGFYDHIVPPPAVAPDDRKDQYTFDQLGVRVPALLISPWVDRGVVSEVFDHTSVLKYLTEKWGLGFLGKRVATANSIGVAVRTDGEPRKDTVTFIHVPHSQSPHPELEADENDHSGHQNSLENLWAVVKDVSSKEAAVDFVESGQDPAALQMKWMLFKAAVGWIFQKLGNWLLKDWRQYQKRAHLVRAAQVKQWIRAGSSGEVLQPLASGKDKAPSKVPETVL